MITRGKKGFLKPKVFTIQASIILPKPQNYIEAHGIIEWYFAASALLL